MKQNVKKFLKCKKFQKQNVKKLLKMKQVTDLTCKDFHAT